MLVGSFSSSPTTLDMSSRLLLAGYVSGFGRLGARKFAPSATWMVYDRKTLTLLCTIERQAVEEVKFFDNFSKNNNLMI